MDKNILRSVLVALFDLARANLPATVQRVGGRVGLPDELTRRALAQLERDGLADATRVRLSMVGLAIATRLCEQRAHQQAQQEAQQQAARVAA